jgi:hypothetical protein
MNSQTAQLTENGTEISFDPLWPIALAYGGHMEQRTSPGELSFTSWNTRAR